VLQPIRDRLQHADHVANIDQIIAFVQAEDMQEDNSKLRSYYLCQDKFFADLHSEELLPVVEAIDFSAADWFADWKQRPTPNIDESKKNGSFWRLACFDERLRQKMIHSVTQEYRFASRRLYSLSMTAAKDTRFIEIDNEQFDTIAAVSEYRRCILCLTILEDKELFSCKMLLLDCTGRLVNLKDCKLTMPEVKRFGDKIFISDTNSDHPNCNNWYLYRAIDVADSLPELLLTHEEVLERGFIKQDFDVHRSDLMILIYKQRIANSPHRLIWKKLNREKVVEFKTFTFAHRDLLTYLKENNPASAARKFDFRFLVVFNKIVCMFLVSFVDDSSGTAAIVALDCANQKFVDCSDLKLHAPEMHSWSIVDCNSYLRCVVIYDVHMRYSVLTIAADRIVYLAQSRVLPNLQLPRNLEPFDVGIYFHGKTNRMFAAYHQSGQVNSEDSKTVLVTYALRY
jgi:hypothetical protein